MDNPHIRGSRPSISLHASATISLPIHLIPPSAQPTFNLHHPSTHPLRPISASTTIPINHTWRESMHHLRMKESIRPTSDAHDQAIRKASRSLGSKRALLRQRRRQWRPGEEQRGRKGGRSVQGSLCMRLDEWTLCCIRRSNIRLHLLNRASSHNTIGGGKTAYKEI